MSKRKYVVQAWEIEGRDGVVTVAETKDRTEVAIRCNGGETVHLNNAQWFALMTLNYDVQVEDIEVQAIKVLASDDALPVEKKLASIALGHLDHLGTPEAKA